jgi:hypothetical protein
MTGHDEHGGVGTEHLQPDRERNRLDRFSFTPTVADRFGKHPRAFFLTLESLDWSL